MNLSHQRKQPAGKSPLKRDDFPRLPNKAAAKCDAAVVTRPCPNGTVCLLVHRIVNAVRAKFAWYIPLHLRVAQLSTISNRPKLLLTFLPLSWVRGGR